MTDLHHVSSKEDIQNVEKVQPDPVSASGLSEEDEHFLATFSPEREKIVYRKVGYPCLVQRGTTGLTVSRSIGD